MKRVAPPSQAEWKEIMHVVRYNQKTENRLDLSHVSDPPRPVCGSVTKWAALIDKWASVNGRKIK